MPRPQTKEDLLKAANENYASLKKLISEMNEKQLSTPFDFSDKPNLREEHWGRDKNVRDVLIHLYEWHQLVKTFVKNNTDDEISKNAPKKGISILPEGITWHTIGTMNVGFWKKHQGTSIDSAWSLLDASHNDMLKLINNYSNEELFTKKYFTWTGTSSLGSYFVSSTSSHYDWAIKKIKMHCRKNGSAR